MQQNTTKTSLAVHLASVLIIILAIGYIIITGEEIFLPLVFALLFAILLLPFARLIEQKLNFGRGAASGIAVITFVVGIGIIFYTVGSQISNLGQDWPQFKDQLKTSLTALEHWIALHSNYNIEKQEMYINNAASKALSGSTSVLSHTLLSVSSIILLLVLTLIYTFFILFYRKILLKFLLALMSERNTALVQDVVSNIQIVIRKYILGLLLEMLIVAILSCTSFALLGIRYFLLLGLITALFNIVPYVGIFTALLLSALITFATTGVSSHLLLVVIVIVLIHLIDSNILLPFIVGSKVSINALVTVIGVVAGEMMWGLPGMFLSVPVIAMLKIICDRVESFKPWAILLGHEKAEKKVLKIPAMRKRKQTPVQTNKQ